MRILILLASVALLFSCKANKEANPSQEKTQTAKSGNSVSISIHFQEYRPYCGGAAPSPEIEAEVSKGVPYGNKEILFMDVNNKEWKFNTNEKGDVEIMLPAGDYKIYSKGKRDQAQIEKWKGDNWEFNEECLEKYFRESDHFLSLTKESQDTSFRVRNRCWYQGPIPCVKNPKDPPP